MIRSAKETVNFPYTSTQVCYIEVGLNGNVTQIQCNETDMEQAYNRVKKGETQMYAVWPGSYRSDLFIMDDLDKLADAYGIDRGDSHIHDIKWKISSHDDKKSRYAYVDIEFKCGCEFDYGMIKKLALDLRKQLGWEIATSTGLSGCAGKYTIKVLRSSIKDI